MTDDKSWREDKRTSAARGYDNKWRKARAGYLKKHPLCAWCEKTGRVEPAMIVDHIKPHRGDMKVFWDKANWQPLCKHCHDSHKQRMEKSGVVLGCDEEGNPIDPLHPWNRDQEKDDD